LSYALAHAGWGHLAYNLIIQLLFGVYLEVINGPFRVLLVYIMGTLAGSMTSSIFDPTVRTRFFVDHPSCIPPSCIPPTLTTGCSQR